MSAALGEGDVLTCPPLSSGHRWPRRVRGSAKAREPLSCQSAKMDETRAVQRKGPAGHQGHRHTGPWSEAGRMSLARGLFH